MTDLDVVLFMTSGHGLSGAVLSEPFKAGLLWKQKYVVCLEFIGRSQGSVIVVETDLFQTSLWLNVQSDRHWAKQTGTRLNIKTVFPRYGYSHVKDKTVARPSYL